MLLEYGKFNEFLNSFGKELPKVTQDAVCIATVGQDQWSVMYMSYLLAKQAGLNIEFAWSKDKLPDSEVYILPSIRDTGFMSKERFDELIERVKNGAVLYISNNDGIIAQFEELTGIHVCNSYMENAKNTMSVNESAIEFRRGRKFVIDSNETLLYDDSGEHVLIGHKLGKGKIYYLNFPLESMLLEESYAFSKDYYKLYSYIFADYINKHTVISENKFIGLTLHDNGDGSSYAVLVNYSGKEQKTDIKISDDYEIAEYIRGNGTEIAANDASVLLLKRK